jgi:spore coat protein U-like protein
MRDAGGAVMRVRWMVVFMAAVGMLAATPGQAQTANTCTISVTGVAFGNYNVFAASPVDSTGSVSFACGVNVRNIQVSLSRGQSSSFNPRTMTRSGENLTYNLYRNAARTNIWGDGTAGTTQYTIANPANNTTRTIYGRIPAAQDVSAGAYADTVTATINF